MKEKTAAILEQANPDGIRMHTNYSGRGMFGSQTTAVVGTSSDLMIALATIILESYFDHHFFDSQNDMEEFVDDIRKRFRSDQFGRETIFY